MQVFLALYETKNYLLLEHQRQATILKKRLNRDVTHCFSCRSIMTIISLNQSVKQSISQSLVSCKCLTESVIIVDWFSSQMFWRYILDGWYLGFQSFWLDLDFYPLGILIDSIGCFKYRSSWNSCVPTKERRKKNFGWWNNSSWNSGICFSWKRKRSHRSVALPSIMLDFCLVDPVLFLSIFMNALCWLVEAHLHCNVTNASLSTCLL